MFGKKNKPETAATPEANPSAAIKAAFARIEVPGGGALADYAGLSEIIVTKSAVALAISVEPGMEKAFAPVRDAAAAAAQQIVGDKKIMVTLTADKAPAKAAPSGHSHTTPPDTQKPPVPGVRHIVAVASGKGGVGKSTTTVNLALALSQAGLRVGVLDADLYGPSIPRLLGLEGQPAIRQDETIEPHKAFGLKAMSIGLMLKGDQAVIWRGPMAGSALRQLLRETGWGELDVLLIDMPPGTGDIQISLGQQTPLAGAIIVSTPQDLALIDARKAIDMFRKMQVPVLGLVENMSYFRAPDTGMRYDIFGHGGAKAAAAELAIPFLGEVPLEMDVRERSDIGRPIVAEQTDSPAAAPYHALAKTLLAAQPQLNKKN